MRNSILYEVPYSGVFYWKTIFDSVFKKLLKKHCQKVRGNIFISFRLQQEPSNLKISLGLKLSALLKANCSQVLSEIFFRPSCCCLRMEDDTRGTGLLGAFWWRECRDRALHSSPPSGLFSPPAHTTRWERKVRSKGGTYSSNVRTLTHAMCM